MRYLVISDIHGNIQALESVLADAQAAGFDHVLCLGDLVGYGANPEAVVERILQLAPLTVIRGNHDKVACGLEPAYDFHEQARQAIEWTTRALSAGSIATLRALTQGPLEVTPGIWICHGAPFDEDHYIFDARDASRALAGGPVALTLFGHTHVPAAFAAGSRGVQVVLPDLSNDLPGVQVLDWDRERPMLVNVGAVGQPRDGDPRAGYMLYDDAAGTVTWHRVEYDIAAAQRKIIAAGLPEMLANRLSLGL